MREEALRAPTATFLRDLGFAVHHEVPINRRIADLVAVGPQLVAVELKLTDWRAGLRQAMAYQLACPRSYLCLPFPRAVAMTRKAHYFEREAVGVLGCLPGGEVRVVIEAQRSGRTLPFLAHHLRRALRPPRRPASTGNGCRRGRGTPWPERRPGNPGSTPPPGPR